MKASVSSSCSTAVYATGKPFSGAEVRVLLNRGDVTEERFVDFVYQPTRNVDGQIDGVFAHGTDVTAQVTARQRIEEQARELRHASQLKDEFLATLSHELRTPMTAVLGWARLLRMGMSGSETAVAIESIERAAAAQAQLIEDVLDISRITAGKLRLDLRPVDLCDVARAAITALHPTATARRVEILSNLPPAVPPIAGDEGRLQQVIWNLVSNALKFTPKGGTVTVRVIHEGSILRLTVQDTGKGIEPEFLPHLFEPFRQEDSSSTRAYGGIGLGLSIVRSLAELHAGVVTAESEGTNRGATFTVEFPILESPPVIRVPAERAAPLPPASTYTGEVPQLPGLTVLVVDDQDYTRDVAAAMLRLTKATVYTAASVREGLKLLDEHKPDVVLCDIAMPGEDGYEFVRLVREHDGALSRTPIVALTAYSRPQDRIRALSAGFDEYLKKPFEPIDLVETVRRLTTQRP